MHGSSPGVAVANTFFPSPQFLSLAPLKKLLIILAIITLASCASHKHKPNKKLKPGKPIPCPLKDC